jgi:hypothetical protein
MVSTIFTPLRGCEIPAISGFVLEIKAAEKCSFGICKEAIVSFARVLIFNRGTAIAFKLIHLQLTLFLEREYYKRCSVVIKMRTSSSA